MKKCIIELGIGLICLGFGIKYTNKGMIDFFKAKASKQQENKVEE